MVRLGRKYSRYGFGGDFLKWIISDNHEPYNSYGNGAAMRVSACGIVAKSLEETIFLARQVTEISHNHPEAMKAAEAVSVAIYYGIPNKLKRKVMSFFDTNLNAELLQIISAFEKKYPTKIHATMFYTVKAIWHNNLLKNSPPKKEVLFF